MDYENTLGDDITKSTKQLLQIDCELDRFKMLDATLYTGQMGKGKLDYMMDLKKEWVWVSPDSTWHALTKTVCMIP